MNIKELVISTNDLTATEDFYTNILQFLIIKKSSTSISYRIGASKLIFEQVSNAESPQYHFAFNIPINQLNEAIEWLSDKVKLIEIIDNEFIANFENWKAQSVYFYDNNQNILEFICRADLRNASESAFSSESIINISEVGIVTESPLLLGEQIMTKAPIQFFSKGPKLEEFVAMGDDNGLFVISNPNRNWYPTQHRATKQKVQVTINIEQNDFEFTFIGE